MSYYKKGRKLNVRCLCSTLRFLSRKIHIEYSIISVFGLLRAGSVSTVSHSKNLLQTGKRIRRFFRTLRSITLLTFSGSPLLGSSQNHFASWITILRSAKKI